MTIQLCVSVEQYSQNIKEMKLKMKQEALVPRLKSKNPLDNLDCKSRNRLFRFDNILKIVTFMLLFL